MFLDLRSLVNTDLSKSFPQAVEAARQAGLDPESDVLPVVPGAHYHMGGVATDESGRTSVPGLWACGEVATTGVHGANRLASNSLLEGLVYARRVADDVGNATHGSENQPSKLPANPTIEPTVDAGRLTQLRNTVRRTMTRHVGIMRRADGLESAAATLADLQQELESPADLAMAGTNADRETLAAYGETRNLITVARLVTLAAQQREESRGAHFRHDYPLPRPAWCRRQNLTLDSLGTGTIRA